MSELDLDRAFLLAIPYHLPQVMAFRRNVVNVRSELGFRVRAGVRGQADIYCIVRGGGHVEIETKMPGRKLRIEQIAWRQRCEAMQIPYLLLYGIRRSTPAATVESWIEALREAISSWGHARAEGSGE